jgi:rhodanese-related sulfurtransferase
MAIEEVSVEELAAAMDRGARLVDVREPEEFAAFHVPGATLVPLASVPQRLEAFSGEGPTYVICRTGARSMRCEYLAEVGVQAVNVAGGSMAWQLSGRPTQAGAAHQA